MLLLLLYSLLPVCLSLPHPSCLSKYQSPPHQLICFLSLISYSFSTLSCSKMTKILFINLNLFSCFLSSASIPLSVDYIKQLLARFLIEIRRITMDQSAIMLTNVPSKIQDLVHLLTMKTFSVQTQLRRKFCL